MPEANSEAVPAKPARQGGLKSSRKLVLLTALGVLLAGGSAGAWYVKEHNAQPGRPEQHKPAAKPLFVTLDLFTVNLQDYGDRVAQIGVTLQFEDPALEVTIKDRLPAVRNSILLLISSKQVDELLTIEGKQKLAQQIQVRAAQSLGVEVPDPGAPATPGTHKPAPENPIRAVLFSHFIVQ